MMRLTCAALAAFTIVATTSCGLPGALARTAGSVVNAAGGLAGGLSGM